MLVANCASQEIVSVDIMSALPVAHGTDYK